MSTYAFMNRLWPSRPRLPSFRFKNQSRRYWVTQTLVSNSPTDLLKAVRKALPLLPSVSSENPIRTPLLFSISKHIPSDHLAELVSAFQALEKVYDPIGCLSDDINPRGKPSTEAHSVALARWCGTAHSHRSLNGPRLIPFTSRLAPRPSISVGREILPGQSRTKDDEALDRALDLHDQATLTESTLKWDGLWSRENLKEDIPDELRSIPSVVSLSLNSLSTVHSYTESFRRLSLEC